MKLLKLLKRWVNMLFGKSNFHVEQGIGKCYSKESVKGYYNDLTNKISDAVNLDADGIPVNTTISGVQAYFPITIFQYGLGLYDLYLLKGKSKYKDDFLNIAKYALRTQESNGMWDCMAKLKDTAHMTQSSMCQSEGASILLRAFVQTKDKKYFEGATKAIDFMIEDIKKGGTCFYDGDDVIFQEYVSDYNLSVLNGWIFSIFGLFDYTLINNDRKYKKILVKTLVSLARNIKKYDRKFWSNYDLKGTIASPSYHDLHIRQLRILYELFGNEEFNIFSLKWESYKNSKLRLLLSMVIKIKQKLFKNKYYDINTSLVK